MSESIGVALATFNGERYIEQQLESILTQTRKPDLIVVSDGGSSDHTVELCRSISKKHESIEWLILQNDHRLNVIENFKKGMSYCNSDIVFLCDQDDFWYNNKIEEYMKAFESHSDYTVVLSDADVVDANLNKSGRTQWDSIKFNPISESPDRDYLISEMLHRNIFTGMCMAYRNGTFKTADIMSDYMLHDEAIGWFAIFKGKVGFVDKRTAAYRQHGNNAVGSSKYSKFESIKIFKQKIKGSTIRTRNKYQDIVQLYKENESIQQIEYALSFYRTRAELFDMSRFHAMSRFFSLLIKGSYKKYTSKTEHSKIKDFAYIVL